MRSLLLISLFIALGAGAVDSPPASDPTSRPAAVVPTSQSGRRAAATAASSSSLSPTSQSALASHVKSLVKQLASPRFSEREGAQKSLAALGDRAAPYLIEHVSDENPEVAQRVAAILGTPRDPAVRAELGFRLIATTDPDWMERGVYLLFENPCEIREPFTAFVASAEELTRAISAPVIDMLESHCRMDAINRAKAQAIAKNKPEAARRMLKSQEEGRFYDAEAAYWGAIDVLAARHEGPEGSLPTRPVQPTSQPDPPARSPQPKMP